MVDTLTIKNDNKTYNVRISADYFDEAKTALKVHVLEISEVLKTSATSSRKVKDVYVSDRSSRWNGNTNKNLLDKIVQILSRKYKVTTINYF